MMANHEILAACVRELASHEPLHYLEIGVNEGDSAHAVLDEGMTELAVLVDTWGKEAGGTGRGSPDYVIERLKKMGRQVLIITGDSKLVVPSLTHKFDLIFVDGDHSPDGCLIDMKNAFRLLAAGGTMVVDDINHPQHKYIKPLVRKFASDNHLFAQFHDDAHFGVAVLK